VGKAFEIKPDFDLSGMAGGVSAGVDQAAGQIEPIIGAMGQVIVKHCASAVAQLGNITSYISGNFSKQWAGAWNAIGEGFKGTWKAIGNTFSGVINRVVSGINTVISGLNRLHINMPQWLGGGTFGFNLPAIPAVPFMARGGIVSQPTLAMVGERGREAVMPLERNTGWIAELADSIGAVMAARGAYARERSPFGGVVNLYIDGKRFAEAAVEDFAQAAERRGINLSAVRA
jgi:hypothetical protein